MPHSLPVREMAAAAWLLWSWQVSGKIPSSFISWHNQHLPLITLTVGSRQLWLIWALLLRRCIMEYCFPWQARLQLNMTRLCSNEEFLIFESKFGIWRHSKNGGSGILNFLLGTLQDHQGPSPKTIESTWFGQGGPLELLQIWVVSDDPNWANFDNSLAWPS